MDLAFHLSNDGIIAVSVAAAYIATVIMLFRKR